MRFREETSRAFRFLLGSAAFVVLVAGLRVAAPLLVPFLVAVFLAVFTAPAFFWMKRRRVPAPVAAAVIVVGLLSLLGTAALFVGNSLNRFLRLLPAYEARLTEEIVRLGVWLNDHGLRVSWEGLLAQLDPGQTVGFAADVLTSVGGLLTNFLLIFLTLVFILLEASGFPAKLQAAFPRSAVTLDGFEEFARRLNRYVGIKTLMSLLTGLLIYGWTSVCGIEFALLWGLLAFVLNYIPNLGSIIAAFPAILLGLLQHGWGGALVVAAGYLAINLGISNLLEPRLLGRGLGLSPLIVFVSLVVWGWVLGPVGFILGVPLTMTLKIAFGSSERLRWIAVLLGPEVTAPRPSPVAAEGKPVPETPAVH